MDDSKLAEAISNGDHTAFKIFFERHAPPLRAYLISLSGSAVLTEDLIQQTFLTLWRKRKTLKAELSPKSYLYRIAYHGFIDYHRKAKREINMLNNLKKNALEERIWEDEEPQVARIAKLQGIINQLPDRCREILVLNKLQGLKYQQIAEVLNISVKTVESQMRIAFQKIREGFEKP